MKKERSTYLKKEINNLKLIYYGDYSNKFREHTKF